MSGRFEIVQPDYLLGCDRAVPITYTDERAS